MESNTGKRLGWFDSAPRITITNPHKDRRLAGKARVKARKAANKAS